MAEAARAHCVSEDEFYRFVRARQGGRYELVDGQIVAMAGANRRHDRIVTTALRILGNALRGHRCVPFSADTFVKIPAGNRRQGDFGIECGNPPDDSLDAHRPELIAKVLSRTTMELDLIDKLAEYQTVPSLDVIMFIDPNWPQVRIIRRDRGGQWQSPERYNGMDTIIKIPRWNLTIPLAELYEGLVFRPRPMLVEEEPEALTPQA